MTPPITRQHADKWIRFLRSYGPTPHNDSMYAEETAKLSRTYGISPLTFIHPAQNILFDATKPAQGKLENTLLTGTAGDGKTWLLYELWEHLGRNKSELEDRPSYKPLKVDTPAGQRTIHFIFDLSAFAPEKGQPWQADRLDLLNRFACSVTEPCDEFFMIACNDGKLIQVWQALEDSEPGSAAATLKRDIDELLATNKQTIPKRRLLFLNLIRTKTLDVLRLALAELLGRPEWNCFTHLSDDPAYSVNSPLYRNWRCLHDRIFVSRLEALIQLCDANGLHIPIREVWMLLTNALLGHPEAAQYTLKPAELRKVVARNTSALGAIHRNLFGDNLPARKREEQGVFAYLALFRVGQETSNEIDNLILFGQEIPELRPLHARLFVESPQCVSNPLFDRLRADYLNADDFSDEKRESFLSELANERRSIFFRVAPEDEESLHMWNLTVFQSAGKYREELLGHLLRGERVGLHIVEGVVRGLNRAWSGMLVDDGTHLYLTSGLDFTTARISPISLHKVPVITNFYGEGVTIVADEDRLPVLEVHLFGHRVTYNLNLLRYEFLDRVSQGSLPNSFSRECYEDMAAFKSRMLAVWQKAQFETPVALRLVEIDEFGNPREHSINL